MSKRMTASTSISRRGFFLAGLAAAIAGALPAEAQTARQRRRRRRWRRRERRRLREAIRQGHAKPLFQVMRRFERRMNAEVLDVRFHERGPVKVYVFVTLFKDGRIAPFVVDAWTEQVFTPEEAKRHYRIKGTE
ncbi:MAG: hypothetical protein OER56_03995 [Hyphomicrobiales bacterium]|nr:hypothetical protein [Hyphomicrobiales bacterium]